jgi:hypothetical protein
MSLKSWFVMGAVNDRQHAIPTYVRFRLLHPAFVSDPEWAAAVAELQGDDRQLELLRKRGVSLGRPASLQISEGRERVFARPRRAYEQFREAHEPCPARCACGNAPRPLQLESDDEDGIEVAMGYLGQVDFDTATKLVRPEGFSFELPLAPTTGEVSIMLEQEAGETHQLIVSVTHHNRDIGCALRMDHFATPPDSEGCHDYSELIGSFNIVFLPPRELTLFAPT